MKKGRIIGIGLACLTAGTLLAGCGASNSQPAETTTVETTTTTTEATTTATEVSTATTTMEGTIRYEVNELVHEDDKVKVTFVGMGSQNDGMASYVFDVVNKKDDGKVIEIKCDEMWANDVQLPIAIHVYEQIADGAEKRAFIQYVGEDPGVGKFHNVAFILNVSTSDGEELLKTDLLKYEL